MEFFCKSYRSPLYSGTNRDVLPVLAKDTLRSVFYSAIHASWIIISQKEKNKT